MSVNPLTLRRLQDYGVFGSTDEALSSCAAKYRLQDISAEKAQELGFNAISPGIYITYPNEADSRIRYHHTGFAAQQEAGKYGQQPNTKPAVYVPPTISQAHLNDSEIPLMIIEGEFKAIVVDHILNSGLPKPVLIPVAIGGVWSWQSKKNGVEMLPGLSGLVRSGRVVFATFDMDEPVKPGVQQALERLTDALLGLGAMVRVPTWPGTEGKGLDDYACGKAGPKAALQAVISDAQAPGHVMTVLQMNDQFVYDKIQDAVYDFNTGAYVKPQTFKSHYFTEKLHFSITRGTKTVSKEVLLGDYWLSSPAHATCEGRTFIPGAERLVAESPLRPVKQLNTWQAWGVGSGKPVRPIKGDVTPFVNYIKATFSGNKVIPGAPELDPTEYLLKRLAWIFQNPTIKHPTWMYLIGAPMQGKSKLINIITRLIGYKYTSHIDETALSSSFQDWRAEKLLIAFDDVAVLDRSQIKQVLKRVTTENTARVNRKYEKEYTAKSFETFFLATNSLDPLLDHDDRRAVVLEAACPWDRKEWAVFDAWAEEPSSYDALLHYFMHEVEIDEAFATQRPPLTEMRQLVTESAESGWDEFLNSLAAPLPLRWQAPATGHERKFKPTLMTPEMLKALYAVIHGPQEARLEIKHAALTAKLQRFGATRCRPDDCQDPRFRVYYGGKQTTAWTWSKDWAKASVEVIQKELRRLEHDVPELFSAYKHDAKF